MTTETFTPPGDIKIRSILWLRETRFDKILTDDCYCLVTEGHCLEPEIFNHDMVFADPNQTPEVGDFAVLWPRSGKPPSIKRLVMAIPPNFSPDSEVIGLVVVEQFSPPKRYSALADTFEAIHKVVGWMRPKEYGPLRQPVVASGGVNPAIPFHKQMGDRLRVLRQTLGYDTPAAFAKAIDYSARTYLAHERGERTQGAAQHRMMHAVHELTGASYDWLIVGDNRPGLRQVRGVDGSQISFND